MEVLSSFSHYRYLEDAFCFNVDRVIIGGERMHLPLEVGSVVPAGVLPMTLR